jgi:DNA invertase Pin-like site-specific DNA recombinase
MVTKVALYVRVSSEMQVEGFSIDAQLRVMREYAAEQRWEIVREYVEEGFTAEHDRRPQFQILKRDAQLRLFDGLLVHKLDRLYRNLPELLDLVSQLEKMGITLISVTERVDFSTPSGKMLLTNIGMISEFYLNNLREETVKGKYQRALSGYWNSDIPYGYCKGICSHCKDPNGKGYCPAYGKPDRTDGKHLIAHPKDSKGLRLAFELQATIKSDLQVTNELNRRHYRTNRKYHKHSDRRRTGGPKPFCKETVRSMLQNPFYMGFVRYKGQLIPGKHPALVDRELFETAQKVRQQLRRVHGAYPHKIRFFLFSGLIRCANCGFVMRGRTYKRNEKEERQYVDTGHEHSVQCQQSLVKADNIEKQIVAHIRRIRLPKPWIERIIQLTTATEKTQHEERSRMALRSRLDRLQRLFVDGDLTEASYEQERAKVAKQMAQLPVETTTAPKIRALANNMGALWEKMTNLERQTVLNHLFRGIYIRGNTIERVEPRKAFKELFE